MDASSLQEISSTLKKIVLDIDDSLGAQRSEKSSETPEKTSDISSILPNAEPKNDASADSLRRDYLAKSMQWYSPDLINKSISNACLLKLERILYSENMNTHTKYSHLHEKQKFEKLLVDSKSADYHTIEQCLCLIAEDNHETVQNIWKLFKRYSETNFDEYICGYCKIRKQLNIKDCSRYFWRHSIISDQLYENIVISSSDQASHNPLWNDLEKELKQHDTSKNIIEALAATLKNYSNTYAKLSIEIREWLCDPKTKFKCSCQELHLQLLKPADTDTFTTDYDEAEIADKRKSRCKRKSASDTRTPSFRRRDSKRRQIRSQSLTDAEDHQREIIPKRALSCETISSSEFDTDVPISIDRKKVTKIFNFKNIKGPINIGNHSIRMENQEAPDRSDDIGDFIPVGSNKDLQKSVLLNDFKAISQQGTFSASVSSCTSNMVLPVNLITSISEETATSSSVLKSDAAEPLSEKNKNFTTLKLQKPSSTKANTSEAFKSGYGDQSDNIFVKQTAGKAEEKRNQQKSGKDKSMDRKSERTRYSGLDYSSDSSCVNERADMTKGKHSGQNAGTDIAGKFKLKQSGSSFNDVNALESTVITRKDATMKHTADFTNDSDHDTEDDISEPRNSIIEMPINSSLNISVEETASANESLEANDSVNTQSSVQEKRTKSANNRRYGKKSAKTDDKHTLNLRPAQAQIRLLRKVTKEEKTKHTSQTDDKNVETNANVTGQKQTGFLAKPSRKKYLEHTTSTHKNTDRKCEGNQMPRYSYDQSDDIFFEQRADKTKEKRSQQKSS